MSFFSAQLREALVAKGLSVYQLWVNTDLNETLAYNIVNGKRRPTDEAIGKIASWAELGIPFGTLMLWRAMDEYPDLAPALEKIEKTLSKNIEIKKKLTKEIETIESTTENLKKTMTDFLDSLPLEIRYTKVPLDALKKAQKEGKERMKNADSE